MVRLAVIRLALISVCIPGIITGCAGVKPYERGYLADPIMTFDEDSREARRNTSWVEAREGSTGGTGGAGGGCACK